MSKSHNPCMSVYSKNSIKLSLLGQIAFQTFHHSELPGFGHAFSHRPTPQLTNKALVVLIELLEPIYIAFAFYFLLAKA